MNYVYYGHELYHHGIRGQRWGERNGPPYPLSASKHNSVVGESKSNGKVGMNDAATVNVIATVTTVTLSLIANKVYKSMTKRSDLKKDEGKLFSDLNELEQVKTLSNVNNEVAVKANPGFNTHDRSTTTNCPNCTVATELRQRGYDVEARHLSGGKSTVNILNDAFQQNLDWESWKPGTDFLDSSNGLKYKKNSNESTEAFKQRRLTELSNDIAMKSGNSTRGTITYISSRYGMGHIFNYAVDSKGNVTFLDGQSNDSNAVSNINDLDSSFKFSFARLDNLDLSNGVTDYVRKH